VRAVLPDGETVRFGSNAVKDVAGYDLKRLYTGGGEAFGAVTEVTLGITPAR
jgi:glycolate oxidase